MKVRRIGQSVVALAAACLFAAGVSATATASPVFDPNGDGAISPNEVLDAPLFPTTVAPGLDTNADGALSIQEIVVRCDSTQTEDIQINGTNNYIRGYVCNGSFVTVCELTTGGSFEAPDREFRCKE